MTTRADTTSTRTPTTTLASAPTTVSAVGQCSTDLLRNDEDPQLAACLRQPVVRADKRRLALNEGRSPHRTTA